MPGLLVRRMVASLAPLLLMAACAEAAAPTRTTTTPTTAATSAASLDGLSAEQVVEHPDSRIVEFAHATGDDDKRAVVWRFCGPEGECDAPRQAIALTQDGFETRVVPDRTWLFAVSVRIARSGDVLVMDYGRGLSLEVLRADGTVVEVEKSQEATRVVPGELVAGVSYRRARSIFWATDTTTARAHAVPVPEDTRQLIQTDYGQLRAMTARSSYAWSDDGGVTWTERDGAVGRNLLPSLVTSTDATHVVVGGGDGATLFPFNQIRRLDGDGTWSVTDVPGDPTAYVGREAVLPDGRFLVAVEAWSDDRQLDQSLKGTPPGIYVSDGDDWSTYERIESGAPFETPESMQPMVTDLEVSDEGTLITALGPDWTTAWTSTDLGVTWHEMRAR